MSCRFVVLDEFPVYKIYEDGRIVRFKKRSKRDYYRLPFEVRHFINRYGYIEYILFNKNWERKHKAQHRLLAEAFIPKVQGKNYVNHINGTKVDNRLENLEWCTQSENEKHSYAVLGKKASRAHKGRKGYDYPRGEKPVAQISINGDLIKIWFSPSVASIEGGFCLKQISSVCKGRQKTHRGFKWKYL